MTVDFVELDVDTVKSIFKLEDGRIIRRSHNYRFDGIDVTDQKLVRVGEDRVPLNRVRYILQNGVAPKGEVLVNDKGDLVDVTDNHLRMVVALRDSNKVQEYMDGKYFGRYIDANGVRRGKAFDTIDEAREYARSMTISVWGDIANNYGFELTA